MDSPESVPAVLGEISQLERSLSARNSSDRDVEKDAPLDLREYLTSANDATGARSKRVGVTWEDLEVVGAGGLDNKEYVATFPDALLSFVTFPLHLVKSLVLSKPINMPTRVLLHRNSGLLKPGEMCLVLGRPGAGCSTFLRAIANHRAPFDSVSGDVKYAGISHQEMSKRYMGEVVYNQEEDTHISTLTVAQTLEFALSTKTPGPNGRLSGLSKNEFDGQIRDLLLRMLNITHTKQTLVGDEYVRGVSGGERKRVSIAEMMATRARIQCWDSCTRGLDASTALDLVKSLRVMTDVLHQTTFVSLYQASEGIYELFDKVMVIDQGHQIYYGPPFAARAYFEGLGFKSMPRHSTPDYLTSCTDPKELQYTTGRSNLDVPSIPHVLEHTFHASSIYSDMKQSLEKYKVHQENESVDQEAFRAAVLADKKKGVSKKSPYTLGLTGQVWALARRQFQMRLQDKFQVVTSMSLSTILAVVLGAAYFELPQTAAGGFTRGGVIFASTLNAALDAFGEIPVMMMGRSILWKQTGYGFYRPAALPLANTLADLPFSAVRMFIYNLIIYFMVGLHRSAGAFWTFHLFSYLGFLIIQGYFRTLGLMCQKFDIAFRFSMFIVANIMQYSGYYMPVFLMHRWLFWIYYLNPYSYIFAGLMENEFSRIDLTCTDSYIVPRNPPNLDKYPNTLGPNQVCTLYGASQGSAVVKGEDYIRAGFGMAGVDLWRRNFLVSLGWLIFFQFTQLVAIEYLQTASASRHTTVFLRDGNAKQGAILPKSEQSNELETKGDREEQRTFTWEDVNYTVPVFGSHVRLLKNVHGYVKPGTMTALMGSSGAGKTTCLDVLATRKNIGVISGVMLFDGQPLKLDFARGTAYAEQMDVHEGTTTVREAMRFSAYLRQPFSLSEVEKDAYVEEVIKLLELEPLANAIVATLAAEARKRLTIGVELSSKPELLLFLDEPTSGLDAQSAWNIVRILRRLADSGQAILCTIHQPSELLFESFDRLLLLQRGGETIYFGDIGPDAATVSGYFHRNGAPCPPTSNPAEHILEAIGAGITPRTGNRDWAEIWDSSQECEQAREEIQHIKAQGLTSRPITNNISTRYATPFLYQLKTVASRELIAIWRSPDYVITKLLFHVSVSLVVSLAFLQLGNGVRDLQSRVFVIFWVTLLPSLIMGQLEPRWISNRRSFIRESNSRMYSSQVFALSQMLSEIPCAILCSILYWVLMVYPVGFGKGSAGVNGTGIHLLVILFVELFGVTLGQLIGAISPSVQVAVLSIPFSALVFNTFCGVTIPFPTMVEWARSWLYYLDPYTRILGAMLSTELHGLKISCRENEFAIFTPPSGQTCSTWATEFVQGFGGYLDNPDDMAACRYCQYAVGDEFFVPLNISYGDRWRDTWVLFAFVVFTAMCVVVTSKFLRFSKR